MNASKGEQVDTYWGPREYRERLEKMLASSTDAQPPGAATVFGTVTYPQLQKWTAAYAAWRERIGAAGAAVSIELIGDVTAGPVRSEHTERIDAEFEAQLDAMAASSYGVSRPESLWPTLEQLGRALFETDDEVIAHVNRVGEFVPLRPIADAEKLMAAAVRYIGTMARCHARAAAGELPEAKWLGRANRRAEAVLRAMGGRS